MMKKESGNALFMILIAIFLLGALTALISRTGGNTEETGDTEQQSIKISEMLRYTGGMASSVENLRSRGCSEMDISFYSDKWTEHGRNYDNAENPLSGNNFDCFVFDSRGAGYAFKTIPEGLSTRTDYIVTGHLAVIGVGEDIPELTIMAGGLSEETCRAINRQLGVESFAVDGVQGNAYNGVFMLWSAIGDDNTHPEYVNGRKAACMQDTGHDIFSNGEYFFYQVLLPR